MMRTQWTQRCAKNITLYFLLPLSHESLPRYTPNVSTTALKKAMAISQGVSSEEKRFGSLVWSGLNVVSKKIQREEKAKIHLAHALKNCLWYCVTVINLYQSVQQQKIAYYLNLLDCIFFYERNKRLNKINKQNKRKTASQLLWSLRNGQRTYFPLFFLELFAPPNWKMKFIYEYSWHSPTLWPWTPSSNIIVITEEIKKLQIYEGTYS